MVKIPEKNKKFWRYVENVRDLCYLGAKLKQECEK
jgi:hypothetical protein